MANKYPYMWHSIDHTTIYSDNNQPVTPPSPSNPAHCSDKKSSVLSSLKATASLCMLLLLFVLLPSISWGQNNLTWSNSNRPINNSNSVTITCGSSYTLTASTRTTATVTFRPSNSSCKLRITCTADGFRGNNNNTRDYITLSGGTTTPSYRNNSNPRWYNAGA